MRHVTSPFPAADVLLGSIGGRFIAQAALKRGLRIRRYGTPCAVLHKQYIGSGVGTKSVECAGQHCPVRTSAAGALRLHVLEGSCLYLLYVQ